VPTPGLCTSLDGVGQPPTGNDSLVAAPRTFSYTLYTDFRRSYTAKALYPRCWYLHDADFLGYHFFRGFVLSKVKPTDKSKELVLVLDHCYSASWCKLLQVRHVLAVAGIKLTIGSWQEDIAAGTQFPCHITIQASGVDLTSPNTFTPMWISLQDKDFRKERDRISLFGPCCLLFPAMCEVGIAVVITTSLSSQLYC